jgi:hypothetical protein
MKTSFSNPNQKQLTYQIHFLCDEETPQILDFSHGINLLVIQHILYED